MDQEFTRRGLLGAAALTASAATATAAAAQTPDARAPAAPAPARPASPLAGDTAGPVFVTAETRTGKVLGQVNAGIREFKGIPYGAPTGGRNRWRAPQPPQAWTGVREMLSYGKVSPQTLSDLRSDYGMMIMWDRHVSGMGEDQLTLNVWTPGLRDGAKRPVLVSFHGGGWATGSGNAPGFDGAQLARFGDAVVVTVNHRLAAFGYVNLQDVGGGDAFGDAGAVGVQDMAASLRWVRDNIEDFGGDPQKVMVFGQSGGGAKTSTLLATPAAKGLFQRAAVQSGSQLRFVEREAGARTAALLLAELNLDKGSVARIRDVPWTTLLEAQTRATLKGANFTPVLDGRTLPHHGWDPAAPAESADVPLIVSTTLEDAALRLTNWDLDEAGMTRLLTQRYGPKASEVIALYRARYPKHPPYLVQAQAFTDAAGRKAAHRQAELKAAQSPGKVWMYQWDWPCPAFDGKFGAVHGIDVSASFHNVRDQTVGSGSASGRRMCDALASAWVAFARTGDPNNPGIPRWPAYDAQTRQTMLFNDPPRVEADPRGEIRRWWAAQPPAPSPLG